MTAQPRRRSLKDVVAHLAGIVGPDSCLLAGAMAVAAHGYPRATKDVDLISRLPLAEVRRRLIGAGVEAVLRKGDVLAGEFPCVSGTWGGVRYDVLPLLVPIDWDRSPEVAILPRLKLRVVELPALLALKLRVGGPQDLLDVAMLVLAHPRQRKHTLALAEAYGLRERVENVLANPRILRSHAELKAGGRF
jgi:hypothetical protein